MAEYAQPIMAGPDAVAMVRQWCAFFAGNPKIARWLERNPPPGDWPSTALEYAVWWMPYADLYGQEIVQVMGQAHANLAAWYEAHFKHTRRDLKQLAGALARELG